MTNLSGRMNKLVDFYELDGRLPKPISHFGTAWRTEFQLRIVHQDVSNEISFSSVSEGLHLEMSALMVVLCHKCCHLTLDKQFANYVMPFSNKNQMNQISLSYLKIYTQLC
ncbi:hypothetical protein AVEN_229635-1 [Araneus ventricosus]|uniref:Uncharacterized protein n=1 Tax=Araneus ventricosus TaxID=182803 RepID=A0A4Y2HV20_ARAVE|nr:hypothetical protein AVEN_229635-1 [Araneus ventricosus]